MKIGRNAPCPCGSGIKYKKCCLDKNKAGVPVEQVAAVETVKQVEAVEVAMTPVDVQSVEWATPLYAQTAEVIENKMNGRYAEEDLQKALELWSSFSSEEQPNYKKAEVYAAAAEYVAAGQDNGITQTELSNIYGVSAGTISDRAKQLQDFAMAK